jgi:hypothetical protein
MRVYAIKAGALTRTAARLDARALPQVGVVLSLVPAGFWHSDHELFTCHSNILFANHTRRLWTGA